MEETFNGLDFDNCEYPVEDQDSDEFSWLNE